ncbi:DNRLRE domain-containing protein [Streptomyces sp. NPDC058662]|uniref:DNRLRE domain-containing protein n=1 Tax=Streptomyces sp. NPDC058662 TaxID=3346583 RepID=UPI003646214B
MVALTGLCVTLTPAHASPTPAVLVAAAAQGLTPEQKAQDSARSSGQPVEILEKRTEDTRTLANPSGTFTLERHTSPKWVKKGGKWADLDASLQVSAKGVLTPKASLLPLSLSGGGTGPLVSLTDGDKEISLTWPQALPKPRISGDTATYPEVLPGVDLKVRAGIEGFSQVLEVKSAEAAAHPKLAEIGFGLRTKNLTVAADGQGNLTAKDAAGQIVFGGPTPTMWESTPTAGQQKVASAARSVLSAPSAGAPAAPAAPAAQDGSASTAWEPGLNAKQAAMATKVDGSTLKVVPDQKLLKGRETVYPVFIDPWMSGGRVNWTRVYKKFPGTAFWNKNELARVGYENESNGLSRSIYQMDTSGFAGKNVIRGTFSTRLEWSWSCDARPVQLWFTGAISANTTWNAQPGWNQHLATVNTSKGWGPNCPAGGVEFDVTGKMREAAAGGWRDVTLGLKAENESDTYGWKKFLNSATLSIEYNQTPNTPGELHMTPQPTAQGYIGKNNLADGVHLRARISDPDSGNVTARFRVHYVDRGGWFNEGTVSVPSGGLADFRLPDGWLPWDESYAWEVQADDGTSASRWEGGGRFTVKRTAPPAPKVDIDPERGIATFTAEGAEGGDHVQAYRFGINTDQPTRRVEAWNGKAAVLLPKMGEGRYEIKAYATDKAGNDSLATLNSGIQWDDNNTATSLADATTTQGSHMVAVAGGRVWHGFTGGSVQDTTPEIGELANVEQVATIGADSQLHVLALTGGKIHHAVRLPTAWQPWGDATAAAGGLAGVTQIAAAQDGWNMVVAAVADGKVYLTTRYPDRWDPWRLVPGTPAQLDQVTLAAVNGQPHMAILSGGLAHHSAQIAPGNWHPFAQLPIATPLASIEASASTGTGAEFQLAAAAEGRVYHTTRRVDGTWSVWGDVTASVGNPGYIRKLLGTPAGDGFRLTAIANGTISQTTRASNGHWSAWKDIYQP